MLSLSELKKGTIFKHSNAPYQVLNYEHSHLGRGAATVRVKAKNLISNKVLTLAYKGNDQVDKADLTYKPADYLYQEDNKAYFMDNETFDQLWLDVDQISDKIGYIKPGASVDILFFEGRPVAISLPVKVALRVEHTEPAVKGDTAQGSVMKPATLETGRQMNVPLFIKPGDVIKVNTETGEYVERV